MQLVEALAVALEHDQVSSAPPPEGDLAPTATVMYCAGDDTSTASTPPLNHYPSPRVRTNSVSYTHLRAHETRRHL
eukprot:7509726-Prorocentrum_lima.AAC.1